MLRMLNLDWKTGDTKLMAQMVGLIAIIHFVLEALIMGMLSNWNLTVDVVRYALLDATWLTILSSPIIYFWVARPFIVSSREAEKSLSQKVEEQRKTLALNEELRTRLQRSNSLIAEINEKTLQQIGADLHDGPAQLITYCLLRLGKLEPAIVAGDPRQADELSRLRMAMSEVLAEVRALCLGLSLPQLASATLEETVMAAVHQHEEQTGTKVEVSFASVLPEAVPQPHKVCVYRVVQESLTNAYKHARGAGQKVTCVADPDLTIKISDNGPGVSSPAADAAGLGLVGMRARAEALGGSLTASNGSPAGTIVTLRLNFDPGLAENAA